jgi:peptidoglycan L-alanyl-D-glutamate endopeptidase CwlK
MVGGAAAGAAAGAAVGGPLGAAAGAVVGGLAGAVAGAPDAGPALAKDIADTCTDQVVAQMLPGAKVANIKAHRPLILAALRQQGLADRGMVLMAFATIAAETAGCVPIDEGQSRFNTSPGGHPFDLYDDRAQLGNRGRPDGAAFKGRGFIQLTGRENYEKIGGALKVDLVGEPERANDPATAADILALFLKRKEQAIRAALDKGDLKVARKLVNGGSHGLDNFTKAFRRGEAILPD